jgi:hypothetical protein
MGPMVALVGFVLLLLFPVGLILFNRRFSRKQKIAGIAASALFSWAGFSVFYALTALTPPATPTPPQRP